MPTNLIPLAFSPSSRLRDHAKQAINEQEDVSLKAVARCLATCGVEHKGGAPRLPPPLFRLMSVKEFSGSTGRNVVVTNLSKVLAYKREESRKLYFPDLKDNMLCSLFKVRSGASLASGSRRSFQMYKFMVFSFKMDNFQE